jgi:arylformamidase
MKSFEGADIMRKLIDLTHVIDPKTAPRKFTVETIGAETVNQNVVRLAGQWYIMSNISMVSHIGTHIEMPYHLFPDGADLATVDLNTLCGPAVLVDLRAVPAGQPITVPALEAAIRAAGGIRPGDIVVCNLGYSDRYGTDEYGKSPYFTNEAIRLLVDAGMKMMAVDAGGVEIPKSEQHVNHTALLEKNICLIENIAHLNDLPCARFELCAFPVPVAGVESFPVRVVAAVEA